MLRGNGMGTRFSFKIAGDASQNSKCCELFENKNHLLGRNVHFNLKRIKTPIKANFSPVKLANIKKKKRCSLINHEAARWVYSCSTGTYFGVTCQESHLASWSIMDPVIPLLGMYYKKIIWNVHRDLCPKMGSRVLFTIGNNLMSISRGTVI